MSGKFKVGDTVRVIDSDAPQFDRVGTVVYFDPQDAAFPYTVTFGTDWPRPPFAEHHLTLADPWNTAVLDQMDAESTDPVSAPSHYRSHPSGIETITITRHESFLRGNVLKYVLRAPYKGSEIEDLKKAAQYLQWEIDRAEAAQ